MASTSESGHAYNVVNFESLFNSVKAFGNAYNPSKDSLKTPALLALLDAAKASLNQVNMALADYSNAVAARELAFKPLNKLITRVYNAIKATGTSAKVDENALSIIRKLQGKRASAKLTEDEKKALEAEGKNVNQISSSQMSYDLRIENLDKLITLLSSIVLYNPNEEDLKITALKNIHNDLKEKNAAVLTTAIELKNIRISRNEILYKEISGLVNIAYDIKIYIKSLFGATSPQYKQISKISFTIPRL